MSDNNYNAWFFETPTTNGYKTVFPSNDKQSVLLKDQDTFLRHMNGNISPALDSQRPVSLSNLINLNSTPETKPENFSRKLFISGLPYDITKDKTVFPSNDKQSVLLKDQDTFLRHMNGNISPALDSQQPVSLSNLIKLNSTPETKPETFSRKLFICRLPYDITEDKTVFPSNDKQSVLLKDQDTFLRHMNRNISPALDSQWPVSLSNLIKLNSIPETKPETFSRKVFIGGLPYDITEDKRVFPSTDKQSVCLEDQDTFLQQVNTNMSPALDSLKQVSLSNLIKLNSTPETFSRKVFIGGLPYDITKDDIINKFNQFGPLDVYWPRKEENQQSKPHKGYAFILFNHENSVHKLVNNCMKNKNRLYLCLSSEMETSKVVEIRPWYLSDLMYIEADKREIDLHHAVFVAGLPRPLKAGELAIQMKYLYGNVCYASIDTETNLNYPKNSGRVVFYSNKSHKAAIEDRFVKLFNGRTSKRTEVKPFVMPDQPCDSCKSNCSWNKKSNRGPFFCANKACLQYYCKHCWQVVHSDPNKKTHKPVIRKGAEGNYKIHRFC